MLLHGSRLHQLWQLLPLHGRLLLPMVVMHVYVTDTHTQLPLARRCCMCLRRPLLLLSEEIWPVLGGLPGLRSCPDGDMRHRKQCTKRPQHEASNGATR